MKFWKSLSNLIEETLPEWRDKFLSYKDLKQQLKEIYPKQNDEIERPNKRMRLSEEEVLDGEDCAKDVVDFVEVLEKEIEKFNVFFEDQEEDYVIRLKVLKDRVAEANDSNEELIKVGREIVDFHGEMVLLLNYSSLNYTGVVKILKKYDKLSGALIRLPFIRKVLHEPFFRADVLNKLVKECETMLDRFFSISNQSTPTIPTHGNQPSGIDTDTDNENTRFKVPEELAEIKNMESMYVRLTVSALRVLKEIRSGSSTVNAFSLPPWQSNVEEVWQRAPVFEQAARSS